MKKLTKEDFIKRANVVHNYKFDYSLVKYTNIHVKIIIICPIHGKFTVSPSSHLQGFDCCKCAFDKRKLGKKEFIKRARLKHGDKYDYSQIDYKGMNKKITIICKKHGKFSQRTEHHLNGHGCKKCANMYCDLEMFIAQSNKIHSYKYKYNNANYIGNFTNITITCPIHGDFEQLPANHKLGHGCPKCSLIGFSKERWVKFCNRKGIFKSKVYIIKCFNENEEFIKIGLTSREVKVRFGSKFLMPYNYQILHEYSMNNEEAWELEKKLQLKFVKNSYYPHIFFNGHLECYDISILKTLNLKKLC